jgi:hypothetical protein
MTDHSIETPKNAPEGHAIPEARSTLRIEPVSMGLRAGLEFDCIEALIEYSEGPLHR